MRCGTMNKLREPITLGYRHQAIPANRINPRTCILMASFDIVGQYAWISNHTCINVWLVITGWLLLIHARHSLAAKLPMN